MLPEVLNKKPVFSEMEISPIGLDMAAPGRPDHINLRQGDGPRDKSPEAIRQHAFDMLDAAYQFGIRYFDTAASYGTSEQLLGEWIFNRGYHLQGLTAATRWDYIHMADGQTRVKCHAIRKHTLENLNTSFVWSCLRLGKAMKIYQIHSAILESGVLENMQILNRLAGIRDDGRLTGLAVSGPGQPELIDKAIEIRIDGEPLFCTIQATWNLLERSAGQALQRASDAGMAVIVRQVTANGRLTDSNHEPGFKAKLERLNHTADALNCSLDQLALAAAVHQPWSDVVLSGASTIKQLESNCRSLNVRWTNEITEQFSDLVEAPEDYWRARVD